MAATSDKELFEKFEALDKDEIYNNIVEIITAALKIKKAVVEEDETEEGLRKILNFGHTLGHAIESAEGLSGLYHGECVALGMLAISESPVRDRLYSVLKKIGLPTVYTGDLEHAFTFLTHDKKCIEDGVSVVLCPEIGHYEIKDISLDDFKKIIKK
jgi:3-dehydroquinate synthase